MSYNYDWNGMNDIIRVKDVAKVKKLIKDSDNDNWMHVESFEEASKAKVVGNEKIIPITHFLAFGDKEDDGMGYDGSSINHADPHEMDELLTDMCPSLEPFEGWVVQECFPVEKEVCCHKLVWDGKKFRILDYELKKTTYQIDI